MMRDQPAAKNWMALLIFKFKAAWWGVKKWKETQKSHYYYYYLMKDEQQKEIFKTLGGGS